MEFIRELLKEIGLPEQDRAALESQIILHALERAVIKLADKLTEEEKRVLQAFNAHPELTQKSALEEIFREPTRQGILESALFEVVKGLLDDPQVVPAEKRGIILGKLEAKLLSLQV